MCEARISLPSHSRRSTRATATWPGCGLSAFRRGSENTSVARKASHERAPITTAALRLRRALIMPASAWAAETCVPLIRSRPSLGPSSTGSRPACESACSPDSVRPRYRASPRPTRTSAMCASGARSPEAPTEPCEGTTGRRSSLMHRTINSRSSCENTGVARRQAVQLEQHRQAHDRAGNGFPNAGGVRPHEIELQRAQVVRWNAFQRQAPETRVGAVHRGNRRPRPGAAPCWPNRSGQQPPDAAPRGSVRPAPLRLPSAQATVRQA